MVTISPNLVDWLGALQKLNESIDLRNARAADTGVIGASSCRAGLEVLQLVTFQRWTSIMAIEGDGTGESPPRRPFRAQGHALLVKKCCGWPRTNFSSALDGASVPLCGMHGPQT